MKRLGQLIILFLFWLIAFVGCKPQGEPLIVWRKISNQMINSYGGYLFLQAQKDSVLYSGIHVAKIWAQIYNISDTISIVRFGHVYSISNPLPTLNTASSVFTSDSTTFDPNDSTLSFVSLLPGLSLDTSYYVRSFVIIRYKNSGRTDTAYNQYVETFRTAKPQDIWFVRKSMLGADPRTEAVSFVIKGVPYVGTGMNGFKVLRDFWTYDANTDSWTQVASIPIGRYKASCFVLDDTVYVGLGLVSIDNETSFVGDFYKYSPVTKYWTRIDSIDENEERFDAVGFAAYYNGRIQGFIAFGKDYYARNDIYKYDYMKDTSFFTPRGAAWEKVATLNPARYGAVAVSNGYQVILGGGKNENGYLNDFYVYEPNTNISYFRPIAQGFPGPGRYDAVAALIKYERDDTTYEMFYYGTGRNDTAYFNDWYAYDLRQPHWIKKSYIHEDFYVGPPRAGAVSFVVNKDVVQYGLSIRIFVVGGRSKDRYLNDVWEYLP